MSGPVIVLSIILFVAVILAGLVYLFTAAGQAGRENRARYALYRQKLQAARRDYHWVRKQVEANWPIWPRPLLFEDIDHHTQLTFGRASYAMEGLERTFAALEAVDPLDSGQGALLNIPENIRRVRAGAANKKALAEFDALYPQIEEAKLIIRENEDALVAIKQAIRESTAKLARDFEAAGQNIQFFYALGAARYEDAMRNIALTQACLNDAESEMHEAERADLVEWATADCLNGLGALSLDIFNLKGRSFTFSEAYEADLVLEKLNALSDELQAGLDYARFHDWAYLVSTQNGLIGLQAELQTAQGLLADFDTQVQKFKTLADQLSAINIDDLIQNAAQAQRELEDYLGAPGESADWEKIRAPYEPPALLLEQKKAQFTQQIEPAFQGMVIRQSELPVLIDPVTDFLLGIKKISALTNHLEIWTSEYRRCERETRQMLDSSGEVGRLVRRIEAFADDSTPETMLTCQVIRQAYQRCAERANGPRQQAGFIVLVKEVKALGSACETVIAQHEDAVEAAQIEAVNTYRVLQQVHNRLVEDYQPRRPAIQDIDWALLHEDYASVVQQYEARGSRYSAILEATKRMQALSAAESQLVRTCEQEFTLYQSQYNHLSRQIMTAQAEIGRSLESLQKNWRRPLSEFITILQAYQVQYRRLAEQVQAIPDAPNMQAARRQLEALDQDVTGLDEMRYELVSQAIELKRELDELKMYVGSLKNRKLTETNMKAWTGANKSIFDAEKTTDPVKAKEYLRAATKILEYAHLYTPPTSPAPVSERLGKLENRGMANVEKDSRKGPPGPSSRL